MKHSPNMNQNFNWPEKVYRFKIRKIFEQKNVAFDKKWFSKSFSKELAKKDFCEKKSDKRLREKKQNFKKATLKPFSVGWGDPFLLSLLLRYSKNNTRKRHIISPSFAWITFQTVTSFSVKPTKFILVWRVELFSFLQTSTVWCSLISMMHTFKKNLI